MNGEMFSAARPEAELVLCCARARLGPDQLERIRTVLLRELDWPLLCAIADEHRVVPLVYWHLRDLAARHIPPTWMAVLRERFEGMAQHNLSLTCELVSILGLLEAHGLQAVPYKGPVLAVLAYQNLALREFGDLDILVRQREVARARQLLRARGYRDDPDWAASEQRFPARIPGQYLFVHEDGSSLVELHTERTLRYFPKPLDFDALEPRLEDLSLGGRRIRSLAPEDLLPMLCVHGAKHFWSRLQWISDIAQLVRLPREMDWPLLRERSKQMNAERMLFLGLRLAKDLIGTEFPQEIARRVEADRAVRTLAMRVERRILGQDRSRQGVIQRSVFRVRSRESPWRGLRYLFRLATAPTEADWSAVRLPAPLRPLYSALRPLRLARRYGLGLVRRVEPDLAGFEPTPPDVVERMLALGEVGPGDVVYDLGCGDGRIVILAAKQFGARAVGVDLDPWCLARARANARREGMQRRVTFLRQDAKLVDLSLATVVTLYLTMAGNLRVLPRLERDIRPGARIVSRDFRIPGWTPAKHERIRLASGAITSLFLWRKDVPAVQPSLPQDSDQYAVATAPKQARPAN